ncbi:hypothetical protein NQ317_011125 [Molorchus minor]|uniref:Uncharacterized protein n=1 Tax=Molorchus minor TaxID=1323400 RepID=A0ABQ9K3X8_9CUCU|nr:hypothetical protein NQ317_011125 [Molorchus minor]
MIPSPTEDKRKFLVNPLTGELEPQSSNESDNEELKDVFIGLPSPATLSDDDTSSTTRPIETRSSDTTKPPRLKNSKVRERGRDSPALKQEKIKLRLKLEKSEPINTAYKVDVSFINTQPKKASASIMTAGEELREHVKVRKNDGITGADGGELMGNTGGPPVGETTMDQLKSKVGSLEQKKFKKFKPTHEHKDIVASLTQESDLKSKFVIHNHYTKDKQKERRGSDSELVRNNKKYIDSNGITCDEKKRRLSQAEQLDEDQPAVLGSN